MTNRFHTKYVRNSLCFSLKEILKGRVMHHFSVCVSDQQRDGLRFTWFTDISAATLGPVSSFSSLLFQTQHTHLRWDQLSSNRLGYQTQAEGYDQYATPWPLWCKNTSNFLPKAAKATSNGNQPKAPAVTFFLLVLGIEKWSAKTCTHLAI